jgi:hypothetical protein
MREETIMTATHELSDDLPSFLAIDGAAPVDDVARIMRCNDVSPSLRAGEGT